MISVSLDGPKNIHDNIRGIHGNWDRVIETFRKLKKLEKTHKNFEVFFGYTISPFNIGKFKETVEEVKKVFPSVSYDDFHVNIFQLSEIYYHTTQKNVKNINFKEFARMATEEIKDILSNKRFPGIIGLIEKKYLKLGMKYLENWKMPIDCNIYNLSAFIDPYGNVYPCSIFNVNLGNLRKENYNLLKILNSSKALKVRNIIKKKKCPHCWTPCEAHQTIISSLFRP